MSSSTPGGASRRTLLTAAAVGAAGTVAGCDSYAPDVPAAPSAADGGGQSPSPGGGEAPPLGRIEDIPVGGGTIFANAKVVVTQPEAGTVKAFSVACTHQGCAVSEVADGTINCACHGSKFRVSDGSVANGPATAALAPVNVNVQDGAIRLA
jgi:Rieske Fe-S protein